MPRYEVHVRIIHLDEKDRVSGFIVLFSDNLEQCDRYIERQLKNIKLRIWDTEEEKWVK